MLLGALLCEEKGLTPEAKYVLVRLVQCFGMTSPVGLGVKMIAGRFGLTDRQVTESLAMLVARNILCHTSTASGRGRPKSSYILQDEFVQKFEKGDHRVSPQHMSPIVCLLQHEADRPSPSIESSEKVTDSDRLSRLRQRIKPGRLSFVNRLLLAVLLCHADRLGVVRNLGLSDLCRLTGLAQDRLKHRVQRLIEGELIRGYMPGVTSNALFGKAKSVYYLNLQHPVFASSYPLAGVLIYPEPESPIAEAIAVHEDLCSGRARLDRRLRTFRQGGAHDVLEQDLLLGEEPGVVVAAAVVGPRPESKRVLPALQARLDYYASWLLSQCWGELGGRDFPCPTALADIIRGDFVDVRQKGKRPVAYVADTLVGYIYTHARGLARRVRRSLLCVPGSECSQGIAYPMLDYLILPRDPVAKAWKKRSENRWFRAVLVFPKVESASYGCYVVELDGQCTRCERESDISLDKRQWYGLLAKPTAKAISRA